MLMDLPIGNIIIIINMTRYTDTRYVVPTMYYYIRSQLGRVFYYCYHFNQNAECPNDSFFSFRLTVLVFIHFITTHRRRY